MIVLLPYLLVENREFSLAQYVTAGHLCAPLLCPCEHSDKGNGEQGERKGARRVFCAAPSLHCVQDGALVHCHDIVPHARGCLSGGELLYRDAAVDLMRWRHSAEVEA